ncbi:MAG TPA: hypothetical protein [Caudoviricetes sp.]|nr:MAG TPA: hypothetical protein [Caudoviricetes sp.]
MNSGQFLRHFKEAHRVEVQVTRSAKILRGTNKQRPRRPGPLRVLAIQL